MQRKTALHILCILTGVFVSCNKRKLPEQVENSPDFYAKFDLDNGNQSLEAGNNDYYMFSSNILDSAQDIKMFKGELKKSGCSGNGCGYGLAILITDTKLASAGGNMDPTGALSMGQHYYNDISTGTQLYRASFVPVKPRVNVANYKWTISDGQSSDPMVFNSYSVVTQLNINKKYSVSLTYDSSLTQGGCQVSLTNRYKIGSLLWAEANVERIQPFSSFNYQFSTEPVGRPPYSYSWDFGDGSAVATVPNPVHSFPFSSSPYTVKLRVTDGNKDTIFYNYHVVATPDHPCEASFKASVAPIFNPKIFGSVTVLLTDNTGAVYSTKGFLQPDASRFEILSVEDYKKANEHNEPAKRIKARFDCVVMNGGKSIHIQNAEAVFAVSYK
jgi:hypothetical protein